MKTILLIVTLILLLSLISFWMKVSWPFNEKKSTFECGFDPNHENRNSFSMRFFLMTVIFLLFDLEITFIMSIPMHMKSDSLMISSTSHSMIILMFLWSTYLEWNQGALNWFWLDI